MVKTGSFYTDQAGLKLNRNPATCFPGSRIAGVCHHTWLLHTAFQNIKTSSAWSCRPVTSGLSRYKARRIRSSRPVSSYKASLGYRHTEEVTASVQCIGSSKICIFGYSNKPIQSLGPIIDCVSPDKRSLNLFRAMEDGKEQ